MSEFNAFCRTCMHQFEKDPSQSLIECYNIFETKHLAKKLFQCTQLVITPTDGYPQWICKKCYETILTLSDFQRKCRDSAAVFLEIIAMGKNVNSGMAISLKKLKYSKKILGYSIDLDDTHNDNHLIDFTLNEKIFENGPKRTNHLKDMKDLKTNDATLNAKSGNAFKKDSESMKHTGHKKCNNQDFAVTTHQIYKCDVKGCGLEYSSKQEINMHLREQHYSGGNMSTCKYICEFCGKNIKCEGKVRKYEQLHVEDKSKLPFKCSINGCAKTFRNKDQYRKHKNQHHPIICPNTSGETNENLTTCSPLVTSHEYQIISKDNSIKQKTRSYPCRFCRKEFTSNTLRNHHEMVHTGEKPFICDVCGRGFTQANALKLHKRTHTIEGTIKNLTCPLCTRTFNTCVDLKQHVLKHAGEKPYECNACNIKFRYKSNLRRHQRENLCNKSKEQSPFCENNIAIVIEA